MLAKEGESEEREEARKKKKREEGRSILKRPAGAHS
jgi:hypothetical protein